MRFIAKRDFLRVNLQQMAHRLTPSLSPSEGREGVRTASERFRGSMRQNLFGRILSVTCFPIGAFVRNFLRSRAEGFRCLRRNRFGQVDTLDGAKAALLIPGDGAEIVDPASEPVPDA